MREFKSIKDIIRAYPPACLKTITPTAAIACEVVGEFMPSGTKTIAKMVCKELVSEIPANCVVPIVINSKATTQSSASSLAVPPTKFALS